MRDKRTCGGLGRRAQGASKLLDHPSEDENHPALAKPAVESSDVHGLWGERGALWHGTQFWAGDGGGEPLDLVPEKVRPRVDCPHRLAMSVSEDRYLVFADERTLAQILPRRAQAMETRQADRTAAYRRMGLLPESPVMTRAARPPATPH